MATRASKILNLLKKYESGKSEESQLQEQLSSISVIAPVSSRYSFRYTFTILEG
jgi:hypothetical protein